MDQERLRELSDQATMRLLNKPGTASSNRGGWMMIATILIEAWDLYAISFLLIFIKDEYNPTAVELGLATAAVQGGALFGALLGGYVADRLGRKRVFILTMILFIVLALAQGFSMNIWDLIIIRFLLGFPLGSDIANGYAYIMESMSKGTRETMGSRWQFMFGLGEVFAILIITVMYLTGMGHGALWRIGLALGAIPALVLLLARLDLPETPMSLLNLLSRIGHRGVAMWGFGLAFIGLVVGAFALKYDWKIVIVIAACVLMWGHYWDASNGMTINSMVAPPRFKATASGFAYVFVKAASFFGAFIFPVMNAAWGKFGATLAVSVLSAIGFLSAKFILPEMWGYVEQEEAAAVEAALDEAPRPTA